MIDLSACEEFAVLAASTATCAGSFECDISGGKLGVFPGTSITGNFVGYDDATSEESVACAAAGLTAWQQGTALSGTAMLAEMGGLTFTPGVYTHESAINIAATSPQVVLDAEGDPNAQFIFNVGSALTTSANSEIVLRNGAKAENVYWFLGTQLTMGADSIMVGNVLTGAAVTIGSNGKIVGRAIAQTAVTCETACAVVECLDNTHCSDGLSHNGLETCTDNVCQPGIWPSASPSSAPSAVPSVAPSSAPSSIPSSAPSTSPSAAPSVGPSAAPSGTPSSQPSSQPSLSSAPSSSPSAGPSVSGAPSSQPSSQGCEDEPAWTLATPSSTSIMLGPHLSALVGKDCAELQGLVLLENRDDWCRILAQDNIEGKSAVEACCFCGGGKQLELPCEDQGGWGEGDLNCGFVAENNLCEVFKDIKFGLAGGLLPSQACCACGGGAKPDDDSECQRLSSDKRRNLGEESTVYTFDVRDWTTRVGLGESPGVPNLEYLGLGYNILFGNPRGSSISEADPGKTRERAHNRSLLGKRLTPCLFCT
jgi:hypothetical protein